MGASVGVGGFKGRGLQRAQGLCTAAGCGGAPPSNQGVFFVCSYSFRMFALVYDLEAPLQAFWTH